MFFEKINEVMPEGLDLTLTIRKKNGQMTVSAIPKASGVKDDAAKLIAPFTVSGTYSDLDAGFMLAFDQPIRQATGLLTNLKQYEEQLSQAAKNSRPAKEQTGKQAKVVDEKKDKCEKSIKRGEELETQGNHNDALIQYQQARLYAVETDLKTVDDKIRVVKLKMAEQSLFDMPVVNEPAPTTQVTAAPVSSQAAVEPLMAQPVPLPEPTTSPSQQTQPPVQVAVEQAAPMPANQREPVPAAIPTSEPPVAQSVPAAGEPPLAPTQQPSASTTVGQTVQASQSQAGQPVIMQPTLSPPNPIDSLFENEASLIEAAAEPMPSSPSRYPASAGGSSGGLGLVCKSNPQKPMPSWMNYSNGIE